jgi:hydroxymethylbilane synthase
LSRLLRIGTRKSDLALVQTETVISALKESNPDIRCEIVHITTTGDKFLGDLSKVGGKGVFVKEIEEALLDNKIDIAVHSMKDVPYEMTEGLTIPAMLERDDIRDVAICREAKSFIDLPEGAKIGTSSLRRASQIKASFSYLDIEPIRGNINTRLEKMKNGEVSAIVVAKAGIDRMDWADKISVVFEPDMVCPAIGQGAIGMQCRADDELVIEDLLKVNHKDTFTCVNTERIVIRTLQGTCQTAIGGFCQVTKGGNLRMIALVATPDGSKIVRSRHKLPYEEADVLGKVVAKDLINQGALEMLAPTAESA